MRIKNIVLLLTGAILFSCAEDNDVRAPRTLQEYLDINSNRELDSVIACAASASGSTNVSYIFYYPIDGATEIQYYETENTTVDENEFSNYRRKNLSTSAIFGEKLKIFSRTSSEDSWGIVTFLTNGKLHKSDPIQLKIKSKPTKWTNEVTIDYSEGTTEPTFIWSDFTITDNFEYFQVLYDEENDDGESQFISGTFTKEKKFQFYNTANIVSDINGGTTPIDLVVDEEYIFTMMGISEDNWVNLMIEKSFVPRNLDEYVASFSLKLLDEVIAFAANTSGSNSFSNIYYYPIEGATDIRYYETDNVSVVETDLTNYRRVFLTSDEVYGGKLSRFSRSNTAESWCIVTYVVDGNLYTSKPIKIKIASNPTEWSSEIQIPIDFSESLKPKFTWEDDNIDNTRYFQIVTDVTGNFLSGNFTSNTDKTFQYDESVTSRIDGETPPALIFDDSYKFILMGLSEDNWVDLVIQYSFIVQ